jgi:hypothetical protein
VFYLITASFFVLITSTYSVSYSYPPFSLASLFDLPTFVALFCGVTLLILAIGLYSKPTRHKTFGILIIVFSLAGLIGAGGGLGLGFLLGFLGGLLAIDWKPASTPQYASSSALPSPTTVCPRCGYANPTDFEFCGRCGASLGKEETKIY